ncbi:hypothetical protein [Runella sp. SP2]|uniref:hypothetical protein n=1 Tax=Runella sp. SP2 TaxID=2268026 RepID=UPI000F0852FD|nr:hypothetical protein [Runella sp. SP2]AYQ31392.1 hypothetical protein DTQ70_04005 [Runella sp. SP2]
MAKIERPSNEVEIQNSEPTTSKQLKVKGLKPLKDGRIPISHGGLKFDLAQASQDDLQWLYENGCPFVTAE